MTPSQVIESTIKAIEEPSGNLEELPNFKTMVILERSFKRHLLKRVLEVPMIQVIEAIQEIVAEMDIQIHDPEYLSHENLDRFETMIDKVVGVYCETVDRFLTYQTIDKHYLTILKLTCKRAAFNF